MKRILCHILQRQAEPSGSQTGWRARHLESCHECRTSLEKITSLEAQLHSEAPPYNEALCDSIMAQIRSQASAVAPRPAPAVDRFQWNPWLLGGTGLAAAFAVMFVINSSKNPPSTHQADIAPVVVTPPDADLLPPAPEDNSLAQMMHQQELLQRDARKLGAHLREHIILFQPGN